MAGTELGTVQAARGGDVPAAEHALEALLARHPRAIVEAVQAESSPVPVPVPGSVPLRHHRLLEHDTLLDFVVPEDQPVVARLWAEARRRGISSGTVRRRDEPSAPTMLYFVDARADHGVMMALVTDEIAPDRTVIGEDRPPAPPSRLTRSTLDPAGTFISVDEGMIQVLGRPADDLVGRRALELVHPDDYDLTVATWIEMLEHPDVPRREPMRMRMRHADGHYVWLEISHENRLADPDHRDVLSAGVDVTEEMSAHEAVRAREQLLADLVETMPVGLFHVATDGSLRYANERLREMTGVRDAATLDEQLARLAGDSRQRARRLAARALAGEGGDVLLTVRGQGGAGRRHWELRVRPLRDAAGTLIGATGSLEDVTARVVAHEDLEQQATRDPLTGCLNRAAVMRRLEESLRADGGGRCTGTAVVFVDLDDFKSVNDRHGHARGDEVLAEVASRLRASVRGGDAVGRLGGDEFLVVCSGVASAADARRAGRAIAGRIRGGLQTMQDAAVVGATVGVAWTDAPHADAAELVARADADMYRAKRNGTSRAG